MVAAVDMAHHPAPWTVEEWTRLVLAGGYGDGRRIELVEGSLIVSPAPGMWHQLTGDRLRTILEAAAPDGLVAMTAAALPLPALDSGLIPDIMVVDESAAAVDGALPDPSAAHLVVEVVSPSTTATDRHVKPEKYAGAKVPHFWRLELRRFRGQMPGEVPPVLFAYALGAGGEYELVHRVDASSGPVRLTAPFELVVDLAALLPRSRVDQ